MTTPVRLVLVEDNDVFRETLELLFGLRNDVQVVASVRTGDEAPAVCADLQPDVVLMDYRMPGMNGTEATRAVLAACPSTRVVCLSASISRGEIAELEAAGVVGCIRKDDDFDNLVATVHQAAAA
jgi:DNA-binding NarL/FixJ family response regulator